MNPQTCQEAMRVAERIGDIEGSSRPFHNNLGSTSNNRGWTTTTSSEGRGIMRVDRAGQLAGEEEDSRGVPFLLQHNEPH